MNKSRGRLNIVDCVIFAVIIIAVAYAVYAIIVNMQSSGSVTKIEYTIEVPEIKKEFSDKVVKGEAVFDENGEQVGNVKSVSVSQAYHKGADMDGNVVYSKYDGYSTIYVTVEVEAMETKSGFEVNGDYVLAGETYKLRTPSLYFEGQCVNIRSVDE